MLESGCISPPPGNKWERRRISPPLISFHISAACNWLVEDGGIKKILRTPPPTIYWIFRLRVTGNTASYSIVNWEIFHLFNNKNLTHILPSSKWRQGMYGGLVWWISCQRWPSRFLCGPNGANMEVCTHWMQGMFGMRGRQYTMPGMQGLGGNIPAEPRLGETRAPKGCRASQGCSVSTMLVASFQRIPLKISKNIIFNFNL